MNRTRLFWFGVLTLIILGVIAPVSLPAGFGTHNFDKIIHALASGVLTLILSRVMSIRKSVMIAFLLMTGTECIQLYMPSREASFGDALANSIGIVGVWMGHWIHTLLSIKVKQC